MKPFSRFLFLLAACVSTLAAATAWADPPGRVGRISFIGGPVSLHNDHYDEPQAAQLNWPVTSGDTLTATTGSRAEVRIGSTSIRMDGDSQLEFGALDDQQVRLRLLRGTVTVRVRDIEQARQFTLTTLQGSVALNEAGYYRFEAGRRPGSMSVAVFQGAAAFAGAGLSLGIAAGQQAEVFGEANLGYAITAAVQGEFDAWSLARDRRDDESRSVRYVSREMTGYEELDGHGDWREVAEYGPVWYPRSVPAGWVPYRSGHWAWVRPWGWTWIDEAPWGFAPFHYGRWVFVGGIWGWMPGPRVARPVYAPALVAWVGRPGWQISFSVGMAPAVGWFPLGPREVFVPAFPASTVFVQRINAPHVASVARISEAQREPHRAHYVHRSQRDAVTVVPSTVVSSGVAVSRHAYRFGQGQSVDALPAAAPAPALAPPPRRERVVAHVPIPAPVPQERGVSPRAVAPETQVLGHAAPPQRQADMPQAAPRQSRVVVAPPVVPVAPATLPPAVSPAVPTAAPDDARFGAARSREMERAAPPSQRLDTVAPVQAPPQRNMPPAVPRESHVVAPLVVPAAAPAAVPMAAPEDARRSRPSERVAPPPQRMDVVAPVQAPPPRIEREMPRPAMEPRPAVEPRHHAPAPAQAAAPPHWGGTTRDAGPPPRAVEPQRDEKKGNNGMRERREDGKERGHEGREGGRGGKP
ncbi:MAG: FecR domain-containing protein [Betaproteobacteria bacterium]|nr:FecR domain-containing protein [Betaproteobacteria bacterium]